MTCKHEYASVSPTGTSVFALICEHCHQPDPEWLAHVVVVGRGHGEGCKFCAHTKPSHVARPPHPDTMAGR